MQTYSSKSTAIRGAKRANGDDLSNIEIRETSEGRWYWQVKPAPKQLDEKIPAYKVFARWEKSAVEKPVQVVAEYCDANPELTRKEAVYNLVQMGINYSTARTQYQRWFSRQKLA